MNIVYFYAALSSQYIMSAVTFSRFGIHRDRKWAAFLGRQTGERKDGAYTVFSLQCGKLLVVLYPKGGRYPETPGRYFKEGAEGTRDRKRAHTYALQLSQARAFHGAHTRAKMNCGGSSF